MLMARIASRVKNSHAFFRVCFAFTDIQAGCNDRLPPRGATLAVFKTGLV